MVHGFSTVSRNFLALAGVSIHRGSTATRKGDHDRITSDHEGHYHRDRRGSRRVGHERDHNGGAGHRRTN
jgi:hypothetical protein